MNRNSEMLNEIRNLERIIDKFAVGAVKIENVRFTDDITSEVHSVNLLRSKLRYLSVIEKLGSFTEKDSDKKKDVREALLDTTGRIIAQDKAVEEAIVAEYLNDIIQRPDSDDVKQEVLQNLTDVQELVSERSALRSALTKLVSTRMDMEMTLKSEWKKTQEFVDQLQVSDNESTPEMKDLEVQVGKINQMRRLTNSLLLGPGAELDGKWLDVFYSVRESVKVDDLFH